MHPSDRRSKVENILSTIIILGGIPLGLWCRHHPQYFDWVLSGLIVLSICLIIDRIWLIVQTVLEK